MKPVLSMMLVGFALGLLVTACGGSSSSSSSAASSAPAATPVAAVADDGAKVFENNCSSCHGATGQGSPGVFPPLAGNATVTGNPAKVIGIVKNGLTDPITVKGAAYHGTMPAWAKSLSDADIAAVITFARSSWGNKASAVTEAQVAAVR